MKIAADTNLLVRIMTDDDLEQSAIARAEIARADLVAVATSALCELVWVLSQGYRKSPVVIAEALRLLFNAGNVAVDRGAADAGLAHLDAGGDFADGAIAYEGRRLGASVFVTFDRKAVKLLKRAGIAARTPSG